MKDMTDELEMELRSTLDSKINIIAPSHIYYTENEQQVYSKTYDGDAYKAYQNNTLMFVVKKYVVWRSTWSGESEHYADCCCVEINGEEFYCNETFFKEVENTYNSWRKREIERKKAINAASALDFLRGNPR